MDAITALQSLLKESAAAIEHLHSTIASKEECLRRMQEQKTSRQKLLKKLAVEIEVAGNVVLLLKYVSF